MRARHVLVLGVIVLAGVASGERVRERMLSREVEREGESRDEFDLEFTDAA
ncbi:MAG: hypothetical protein U0527_04160 [Candidatus Eisenbacteria bacterium]